MPRFVYYRRNKRIKQFPRNRNERNKKQQRKTGKRQPDLTDIKPAAARTRQIIVFNDQAPLFTDRRNINKECMMNDYSFFCFFTKKC